MTTVDAEYIAAWQALQRSSDPVARRFVEAARARDAARKASQPITGTSGKKLRSGVTVPFGRCKGQPIEEVNDTDLEWVRDRVFESITDPDKARWKSANTTLLAAIEAELETR